MKLSVLVCSTHNRYNTFLPKLLTELFAQWNKLNTEEKKEVEILTLIDNKTIMLGTKRNNLIEIAKGDYVVFVDDDDRVSPQYISRLLTATASHADVITFQVMVSLNGEPPKPCYYSKNYKADYNTPNSYHRLPNHIMAVRRELALLVPFKPVLYGEDSDYSKRLRPMLKTQHEIKYPLYYYDYNLQTTEAQEYQRQVKPVCDVVMLSNAKTPELKQMTQQAIDSLLASQRKGIFNVLVIEQAAETEYNGATTLHRPGQFNYNAFANEGIRLGDAQWLCVTNNDVIFEKSWLAEMMKVKADVMSPLNPGDKRQANIKHPEPGFIAGRNFSGWCFVMRRTIWEKIGGFDEDFPFWCADNATVEQLKKIKVKPVLVPHSEVKHLASATLKTLEKQLRNEITRAQVRKFNKKYNQNLFNLGV